MVDSIMDINELSRRDNSSMKCLHWRNESNGLRMNQFRDCSDSLCQSIVTAHRRVRMTKDHVIGEMDSNSHSMSSSTSSLFSFNSTDTSDEIGSAHNHTLDSSWGSDKIWGYNKENRQDIVSKLTGALLYQQDSGDIGSQSQLDTAGKNTHSACNKFKSTEMDIRALMNMYRMRVDEREKELLNELTATVTDKTASLEREMDTYKAIQASYGRSVLFLDGVLKNGTPFDVLRAKAICDIEIKHAKELQESALFPEERIVFAPPDPDVLSGIRRMGKLAFHESNAPPSILSENISNVRTISEPHKNGTSAMPIASTVDGKSESIQNEEIQTKKLGRTAPSPPKPMLNSWARPIKFKEEPRPIRAIIPQLLMNPKAERVKPASAKNFDYKAAGQPKMIIGKDGSEEGQFSRPWGVCCTNEGNIVVADRSNHRIQIFTPNGKFLRKFGEYGKEGHGVFDRPAGVAVDPRGRIFITDKDNHRIQVFTQQGEFLFMFGREGKKNGQFHYPWDIAINSVGEVAVTDTRNQRVQLFSNDGSFLRKFGIENVYHQADNLDSPRGVCFNTAGNLVVTDFNNHRLLVIDSNFIKAKCLGGPGSGPKQFMRPQGVAVDKKGKIAIADSRNNRIQIINEDGTYAWQFGCSGTDPGQLDRPCGVCFTPDGKIVVVDFGNNRVQIF